MKVLHIVESFAGGVLTMVVQLCNIAAHEGCEVHVAYSLRPETPANFCELFRKEVVLHYVPLCRNVNPARDLKGLYALVGLLRRIKPDIVHLHSSKAGFLGRLAVAMKGSTPKPRLFYTPHAFAFLREDVGRVKSFVYLTLERLADRLGGTIVACSQGEADQAVHRLGHRSPVVIENAIDARDVVVSRRNSDITRIGTCGRISPQKNPQFFSDVAASIGDDRVKFVWIGGGEPEDEAALASLGNVKVTGWLPRDEALRQMAALDIYLQLSRWEGMPLVVIEAMLAQLPVVVSDVVGNRDIVRHGITGFIARTKDDAVRYLWDLINDPELRISMGVSAAEEARTRFSIERLKKDVLDLYFAPGN